MSIIHSITALITLTIAAPTLFAKDKSADYQMGIFTTGSLTADGTVTGNIRSLDGTTIAGGYNPNYVKIYTVRTADGFWSLEPRQEAVDARVRNQGFTATHLGKEKANPLDGLKSGDKVLFRVEHRHMLIGTETTIFIPYADNPNKEVKFVGSFAPFNPPAAQPQKATDNVKAMCNAGKLSPELQKQYCGQ